jgi:hypothetical protein
MSELYTVIRDKKEKSGYWQFNKSLKCNGTIDKTLLTGDYTLLNYEHIFTIERKASTGELSGNLTTRRFENELKRMAVLPHSFLLLEFDLKDICNFPLNSGIPKPIWRKLRVSAGYLLKRLVEIQCTYPNIQIIFAGNRENAQKIALQIFKEMAGRYAEKIN